MASRSDRLTDPQISSSSTDVHAGSLNDSIGAQKGSFDAGGDSITVVKSGVHLHLANDNTTTDDTNEVGLAFGGNDSHGVGNHAGNSRNIRDASQHINKANQFSANQTTLVPRQYQQRIAPISSRGLDPTVAHIHNAEHGKNRGFWKGVVSGAVAGAAAGTYPGMIAGGILGMGVLSIPAAVVGGVAGAVVGGIIGGIVGGIAEKIGGTRRAQRQARHYKNAMQSLRDKGLGLTLDTKNRLESISKDQYRELLHVPGWGFSDNKVTHRKDRQRIREAVLLHLVKTDDPNPFQSAMDYKRELIDASKKGTLHMKADLDDMKKLPGDKSVSDDRFADWMDNYRDAFNTREFWNTQMPPGQYDVRPRFVVQTTAEKLFGASLALGGLKNVCADNHKVTKDDQWMINQGMSPGETDPTFMNDELRDNEVGKKLSDNRKHQLLDAMQQKYNDISTGWNTNRRFRQNFDQEYSAASSVDAKIAVIEKYFKLSTNYVRQNTIDTQGPNILEHADLSKLAWKDTVPHN